MVPRLWLRALPAPVLLAVAACHGSPVSLAPSAPLAPTCPLEGCDGLRTRRMALQHPPDACPSAGGAPCVGGSPSECADRALAAWAEARDDRDVACVARMLTEACSLGDAPACGYAGRMWLDGRGVAPDADRGLAMLLTACDGGVALECLAGLRWLSGAGDDATTKESPALRKRFEDQQGCLGGAADTCMQLGLAFYAGTAPFPRDLERSAAAYRRGCDLGQGLACSNLGDAYEYGSGVPRDLPGAAAFYERACRLGKALGCSNFGHLLEHGEGVAQDVPRARTLFRDSCAGGDVYGCLHAALMAAEDAGAPRDSRGGVDHWQRACDRRDGRACAFLGLLYEDGPDGFARDEARSLRAMSRACDLGNRDGCIWLRFHAAQ